ncbi:MULTISPECIES: 3'(2'),5'-bisphosphate nucleotidase CysQ [Gammaproteobacteria]|uniref:3'(2'),5'-bisphosphate nucleotidase CysQ n=1 Tax=Gammaproteobacteria TaxID=1236 RepID=UPI000DD077BB|nr:MULTISPECIES: 3'(2'),5'-bisphosphate nucleotidase CysQ [Gammaproteobacteria]RTE86442.1 3'(2'),5'-bisphosphate nucleotidase [Aliidiomarina sp. B3213]TCZ91003.1 3'(2'),5'-bisphosphate nucleotidase [Lysobacter sp. N42]
MNPPQYWPEEHLAHLSAEVADIASAVGKKILALQGEGKFDVETKADDSPVTSADLMASEFISEHLHNLNPSLPVLTEESLVDWSVRRDWSSYWLVDPLDGTQEFIYGSGDFAVSIALIHYDMPILGVIYWPAEDALYTAAAGQGAWRLQKGVHQNISVRRLDTPQSDSIKVALSRRQPTERILSRMSSGDRDIEHVYTGSCALKSCLVAEGTADCFVRVGETGEWDTAAAQILVEEAGGSLVDESFRPLKYNRSAQPKNPNFLVLGDPRIDWQDILPQGIAPESS